jgi:hypothetical protein
MVKSKLEDRKINLEMPPLGEALACVPSLADLLVALSAARALPKGQQLHGHLPAVASSHALLAHHLLPRTTQGAAARACGG